MHTNPTIAIAEFEQILLSNSGEDAFESAIKLLAAKLVDEIMSGTNTNRPEQFKIHDTPEITHKAIQDLFIEATLKWPLLGVNGDSLDITPSHLVRSIRPLLGWCLRGSDLSWLDATLERLVGRDSKGSMGQYFTPRDIVQLCVDILNPGPNDLILDPACGSGGFLFESVRHSITKASAAPKCLGIDFSPRSVKVATLLAAALDDSTINISKANSLDGRAYINSFPSEWSDFICQNAASETERAKSWGRWNQIGCDVLLTNPPFAGDIDELDLLDAYESQQCSQSKRTVSREHLFLERAVDLLRPGGRLAIVVPQGILSNSTASYLRSWLLRKCRVLGVIGLHPHAFLPYTAVKTAIVFLSKPDDKESIQKDYPIIFAVSQSAGKDSSGRVSGIADYGQIVQYFRRFLNSEGFSWATSVSSPVEAKTLVETVAASEVMATGRLDAEHYDPYTRFLERRISKISTLSLCDLVENKIPRFKKHSFHEITYLDISSVDNRTGLTFPSSISADEAPSRASYLVAKGDVLVSTVRPDRNVVALVTSEHEHPLVASNGFCVLRAKDIAPELLFAYCKTQAFRRMLTIHSTASMYPTVGDKDVLKMPFLLPTKDIEQKVIDQIRSGFEKIEQAHLEIRDAVALMDKFVSNTTGTE